MSNMRSAAVLATASMLSPTKSHHYLKASSELKESLARAIPRDELKRLHVRSWWRHAAVVVRQVLILAASSWALVRFDHPAVWIPLVFVQGFTIFNFTVLLHEVVHETVSSRHSPLLTRVLGLLYAFPSGISHLQFTRWHLDHHDNLGSSTEDPKRYHLSPKRNARWYKALYFTPALFFIYFRAARREAATYPEPLRRRIARERNLTMLGHVAILAGLWIWLGGAAAARVYAVPYFLVFPIAFALNRLGQHYYIQPEDPAQWSTLVKSSLFWNFTFLWSNFHLEHHYFPRVPFYNLPRLHRQLRPFYRAHGMKPVGYATLLYGWLIRNGTPHTDWSLV
ncbi:MAG: fatty acid desaturase family protein [Candidatus Polarisedimenticolia bacterium]